MRRNVRRLNREVGNIGGREPIQEIQQEEEEDKYEKDSAKKVPKSRKAVNLAGLSLLKSGSNFSLRITALLSCRCRGCA
jgi:hypothetical protein